MATISKEYLSVNSTGAPVQVVATATAGTLIHTAHATSKDEVWLYACNTSASSVDLTIEYGGTTAALVISLGAKQGMVQIVAGTLATNIVIRAFAGTTNVVYITGFVNRIT